jgi:hypothetical protein
MDSYSETEPVNVSTETPKVPMIKPKINLLNGQNGQNGQNVLSQHSKEVRLNEVDTNLRVPVSPSIKLPLLQQQQQQQQQQPSRSADFDQKQQQQQQQQPVKLISPPKPPILLKNKTKEIRICLPSIAEIYASISNEIHKRVIETLSEVLDRVGEDHKLNSDELKDKYLKELKIILEKTQEDVKTSSNGTQAARKPRTVLATEMRCMARVANGSQCTRRKQKDETGTEYDFCGSHRTNQPNGTISDAPLVIVEKKKRGRPPKKTILHDGTSNSADPQNNNDQLESPYDDTTSMDFFEIKDGDYEYICNQNNKIVYEIPLDNQISNISELVRVGIWDPDQRIITYDN